MLYQLLIYPLELLVQMFYTFFFLFLSNPGLAIVGVSFAVSLFTLPLYNIAEKWQQKERDIRLGMQPKIDKIKAVFKGDERYMILSAYYRQQHYHPVFALRSSLSLLIQVPFFIAAYHFLSQLPSLQGVSFYGIKDLGKPDLLIAIGSLQLNLLPILMTLINIAAGVVYTSGFPRKEKIQLYIMSLLFLALLYNSPAGLVLYWTLNNIFSLIKHLIKKIKHPLFVFYVLSTAAVAAAAVFIVFFSDKTPVKKIAVTVLAGLTAALPVFVRFIQWFLNNHLKCLEKDPKKRFAVFLSAVIGFFILSGFFIPTALVSTSVQEFSFIDSYTNPASLLAFPLLQAAGIFLFWCIAVYVLFSEKVKNLSAYLLPVFFFCALINTFILKGNYGGILANLHFDTSIREIPQISMLTVDFTVFIIAALVVLLFFKYLSPKIILSAVMLINISLTISGVTGSIKIQKMYAEYKEIVSRQKEKNEEINTLKPVFNLSKTKKNVAVLMLDRAINSFVPLVFEELPETAEQFRGFIRYPNTAAFNGHTMMASPPLYGGYEYTPEKMNQRADEPLVKKHNEALCVMPRLFSEHGFSSVITDASWANYSWVPDNRIFWQWPNVRAKNLNSTYTSLWAQEHNISLYPQSKILKRNFIFFSFFRMIPSSFRGALYDDGDWWNPEIRNSQTYKNLGVYSALDYLPELTSFDSDENTFSCIVNELTHETFYLQYPEYRLTAQVNDTGSNPFANVTQHQVYHVNAAALKMVGEWLAWLRKNDVYDNTRIIIVSDHGLDERFPAFADFPVMGNLFPGEANALLMVKDFNADFPVKTDMTFMTTADVPFLATMDIIQNPVNPFSGQPISKQGKKDGINFNVTHRFTPDVHKKNTFIIDDEVWHVKDNIFDPKNWRQVK